jgi:hypothetical protein
MVGCITQLTDAHHARDSGTVPAVHERRRYTRLPVQVAVSISTTGRGDRVGVTRDVSDAGLLFHSLSQFAVGERVKVMFVGPRRKPTITTGHVVRAFVDTNQDLFRNITAVAFDAPVAVESPSA